MHRPPIKTVNTEMTIIHKNNEHNDIYWFTVWRHLLNLTEEILKSNRCFIEIADRS